FHSLLVGFPSPLRTWQVLLAFQFNWKPTRGSLSLLPAHALTSQIAVSEETAVDLATFPFLLRERPPMAVRLLDQVVSRRSRLTRLLVEVKLAVFHAL